MAVTCLCGDQLAAQERLEIQISKVGVFLTIEVDRNIEQLDLSASELTSITLPEGLARLNLYGILGDVNAVKKGRIARRIARRAAGKVTGRMLGKLFK